MGVLQVRTAVCAQCMLHKTTISLSSTVHQTTIVSYTIHQKQPLCLKKKVKYTHRTPSSVCVRHHCHCKQLGVHQCAAGLGEMGETWGGTAGVEGSTG